jgi:dTDP-4-amino-4,6-dideoxygalactose transaminase
MNEEIKYEDLWKSNELFIEEYKKSFSDTLNSGWFVLGRNVEDFEKEFSEYCGSKHCIGLASGLDALYLSLKHFDFPAGTEVIVPSNTYIATILSIINCGLKPILAEPDLRTYNIDPDEIIKKISPKTKALMIVHLYGKCCEMDRIMQIAEDFNLKVIEDCAQSHGASFNGKKTGTFGDFGAFSFYPTKNLGALGDAGAVITDDSDYSTFIRTMRNYGSKIKYRNEIPGINSRLDEIQAGFLKIKLKHLDEINSHKRGLADIYFENLSDFFVKPFRDNRFFDVFHIFNIRTHKRDELKNFLMENGVRTDIHYPIPPYMQQAMKGIIDDQVSPIASEIHNTTLSLPISFGNTEEQIYRVCEIMNKFASRN